MNARLAPLLFATLLVSTIGDEITQVALVFRLAPSASGTSIAALLIAFVLPGALVAPYAGRLVDERDAARVLLWASLAQGLLVAALAIVPSPAVAIAGAATLSMLFAFSGAATFALIPVVGAALGLPLARINAAVEFAAGGGAVAGPLVGGALVAAGGSTLALLIDAASFLALAVVLAVSRLTRPPAPTDAGWSPLAVVRGYRPVLRVPGIALLLAALWLVVVGLAVADAVYVFLVTNVLVLGPLAYGVLIAIWAVAYLAGAPLGAALVGRHGRAATLLGGGAMAAGTLGIGLLVPLVGSGLAGAAVVAVAFLLGGAGNAVFNVAVRTTLHQEVSADLHGRAAALWSAGVRVAEAGGLTAGGLLAPARVLLAYTLSGALALAATIAAAAAVRR